MPKKDFEKFIRAKSNASKKEGFRKVKRSIKKEIAEGMAQTKARKAEESAAKAYAKVPKRGYAGAPGRKTDEPTTPKSRPVTPVTKAGAEPTAARPVAGQRTPTAARPAAGQHPPKAEPAAARPVAEKRAPKTEAPSTPRVPKPFREDNRPVPLAPIILRKEAKHAGPGEAAPQMPLNKYIAHCGICSRREAADLVRDSQVKVNGKLILEPGFKITDGDEVKLNDKKIHPSKNLVYILLNKPKDYLTTSSDPEGRKTVLDLVRKATTERIFPVGRLDRNTTGVLLLTNDGDLAQKLAHPAFQIKKVYEVQLDKDLSKKDYEAILTGVELEDGVVIPDALAYADSKNKSIIGIEIHSGKNRIVRRIFEHLGYQVKALDRVVYAGLTKKNVDRGRWRFLLEKEVRLLKYLNASYAEKKAHPKEQKVKS